MAGLNCGRWQYNKRNFTSSRLSECAWMCIVSWKVRCRILPCSIHFQFVMKWNMFKPIIESWSFIDIYLSMANTEWFIPAIFFLLLLFSYSFGTYSLTYLCNFAPKDVIMRFPSLFTVCVNWLLCFSYFVFKLFPYQVNIRDTWNIHCFYSSLYYSSLSDIFLQIFCNHLFFLYSSWLVLGLLLVYVAWELK